MSYPPTNYEWFTAALAWASDGDVIDLGGRDIAAPETVTVTKRVTLRHGTVRGVGVRPVVVDAPGVTFERVAFHSSGVPLSAVSVRAENFLSVDCDYTSDQSSALTFTHGLCTGSTVRGGSCTTYARTQNAAGVYVGAGNVGNYGLTFDGVTVEGGPDRGPDGIIVYDAANTTVRNCTIRGLRALPDAVIPEWVNIGGNVWESVQPVRDDGPTRVLLVDGGEWSEHAYAPDKTRPRPWAWTQGDNKVWINTTTDPNTRPITSRIVSGYGITFYCTAGEWRTMSNNTASHNRVEDVDGFGIYLQLGDVTATGNTTDHNTLINTCLKGEQSNKLPFGAIGVIGGAQTQMTGDLIDGAVGYGFNAQWATDGTEYSGGNIAGMRVRNVTGHGVTIAGGVWHLTGVNATRCTENGFQLVPESTGTHLDVSLTDCEATNNRVHGVNASGAKTSLAGTEAHLAISGGRYAHNGSRGVQASGLDTLTIGSGVAFAHNAGYSLNIANACADVHLDAVRFNHGPAIAVSDDTGSVTTGRLLWGPAVTTKVGGTGAHKVSP